jgi:4'-phosphopantetheinyl transferase
MLSEAADRPPASWDYITGRNGKPSLALERAEGALHFSITHTRGVVACAVCGHHEVGIDAETAKGWRGDPEMISRELSPEETELVAAAPPNLRYEVFFRIWTLKESFVKATGEGLYRPLASFAFRLDPVEITFHPSAKAPDRLDDPAEWQFAEFRPEPRAYLAVTVGCHNTQVTFDASATSAFGIAP